MNPNEKIQLDDITFDDVIAGDGVETISVDDAAPIEDTAEDTKLEVEETDAPETVEAEKQEVDDTLEGDANDTEDYNDDDLKDEDEEGTVVSEVLTKLGYEVDGDYADTADGLAEMTKDVADKMADTRIDEVLENFPLVKKHLEYVLAGGESNNFMQAYDPRSDYNKVSLAEDDSRSQKAILSDYFATKGHDQEFIQEMLEDYEDSGKLYGKAEQARQALGKQQAAQKEQIVANQRQQFESQAKEQQEFWNEVSDTISNSKEFAGLVVPEKEKTKFFKYISTPVNREGQTQRDLDHGEADMETKLGIDYLMYKGFNLETIINTKAKTKSAKSLRDKISKGSANVKSARRAGKNKKIVDYDDLDLNI
tara:strand:+ start:21050 stop:22147 length:1098 start_codon:yes stop_codon:yes gene_type:complete